MENVERVNCKWHVFFRDGTIQFCPHILSSISELEKIQNWASVIYNNLCHIKHNSQCFFTFKILLNLGLHECQVSFWQSDALSIYERNGKFVIISLVNKISQTDIFFLSLFVLFCFQLDNNHNDRFSFLSINILLTLKYNTVLYTRNNI